jgi:hypothetical protein
MVIVLWFVSHPKAAQILPASALLFIFIAPIATGYSLLTGVAAGYHALTRVENVYTLKFKADKISGEVAPENTQLLRTFSSGILVRDPVSQRVTFHKWENVTSLALRVPAPDSTTLICRWIGWKCPPIERIE